MGRKETETETRKQFIINAAARLFLKKGYYLTTVDEIAKRSEFSKPTVYKYFISKEDIAKHVHLMFLSGRIDFFMNAMKGINDPYEKLYAFGISYYEYARMHKSEFFFQLTWDSLIGDEEKVSEEVKSGIERQNEIIGSEIKDCIRRLVRKEHIHPEFDEHCTMVCFYASLRTVIARALTCGNDKCRGKDLYVNFLKILLNGLRY